jgi:SAM-dependent methyltransferase
VRLLRDAIENGVSLTDTQIRGSEYWAFAHYVASIDGTWFGARDDEGFLDVTRNFIDWGLARAPRVTGSAGSPFGDNILAARIAGSPMMQVIDGHHRVAVAIVRGETSLRVNRTWLGSETPLQRRVHELNRSHRRARTLQQPLPALEVAGWAVTSDCTDRLLRMMQFLAAEGSRTARRETFLDVGSSYGWLLGEMKKFGYDVLGVEADARARDIGTSFLGLVPEEVVVGSLTESLEKLPDSYDVASCFGLPEMLGGQNGRDSVGRLFKAIDRVVDGVLFVDTDERLASPGTSPSAGSLSRLLVDNTSFQRVVDLGENHDLVSARHRTRLVALVREG